MHIRLLCKKVLYVFLSLMIVIAPTIQQANASSRWSITNAASSGSRTVVTAATGGYKSAVNIAPTAGRLAARLVKGANWAALVYAAIQLAPDLADIDSFKADYDNNRVSYTLLPDGDYYYISSYSGKKYSTPEAACDLGVPFKFIRAVYSYGDYDCFYHEGGDPNEQVMSKVRTEQKGPTTEYMSIPSIAPRVITNANGGHADSQNATRATALEMVIGGQFDKDLLAGAVPGDDTRPLVPSVPQSGNGNVGVGDNDPTMSGATPGQQADAAKDAADAAKKAAQAAVDAAKSAAESAAKAAGDAKDLINAGADAAEQAAADAKAAEAAKSAADAKSSADAAVAAANDRAKAAELAAEAATQAAADAAKKAERDLSDAKAAGDAAAVAAAEAAKSAAAAELAEAKQKQAAAERAAERAKAEAAKPFELPAFCAWASVVCDYTLWVKEEYGKAKDWVKEEPVANPAEMMPIADDPSGLGGVFQDKAEAGYVSFARQCPDNVLIPVSLMGASQSLNISYAPFCHFASLIRPAVILGAWISGLLIISGGRARE